MNGDALMKKLAAPLALLAVILVSGPGSSKERPAGGFLLNMYHFNIQYVVGSEASMRRIVKQSFEPLVDFYAAHPGWGADFEMQGLMIEYMAESHTEVLDKFRRLVNSGQVSLTSFHYADQLLLAFPGHDQKWSIKLNDRIFEKYGIERSSVIFTQEAQFGEGMCRLGRDHGYDAAVMTTSQYSWFQDDERFPYFSAHGMDVITNRDAIHPDTGVKVKWLFLGDGELVATAGISPYFPGLFRANPAKLKGLEARMTALEKEGYKPSTVSEYVAALREAGLKPAPLRPMLDSPWRPEDGSGVFQWMGKYAFPWEADYDIRSRNWRVRTKLIEAERAGADDEVLAEAWGHMLNAEVSDPTGWFPFPVEIKWDYEQMDLALKALEGAPLPNAAPASPVFRELTDEPPVEVGLFGGALKSKATWEEAEVLSRKAYSVSVEWKGSGGIAFPLAGDYLEYSPAMMEHEVRRIDINDIKPKSIHLALPNGLIGLGDGLYLIRDNAAGCLAAGFYPKAREIRFETSKARGAKIGMRFYIIQESDPVSAAAFASELNSVNP